MTAHKRGYKNHLPRWVPQPQSDPGRARDGGPLPRSALHTRLAAAGTSCFILGPGGLRGGVHGFPRGAAVEGGLVVPVAVA